MTLYPVTFSPWCFVRWNSASALIVPVKPTTVVFIYHHVCEAEERKEEIKEGKFESAKEYILYYYYAPPELTFITYLYLIRKSFRGLRPKCAKKSLPPPRLPVKSLHVPVCKFWGIILRNLRPRPYQDHISISEFLWKSTFRNCSVNLIYFDKGTYRLSFEGQPTSHDKNSERFSYNSVKMLIFDDFSKKYDDVITETKISYLKFLLLVRHTIKLPSLVKSDKYFGRL